ncbi:hypothetical protein Gpo141_00011817, partial [Globisporangium polare]
MGPPSSIAVELKFRSAPDARVVTRFTHIRTLLWKNWTIKKRHPYATIGEVLLPVLFIILLSLLKGLTNNVDVPAGFSDSSGKGFTMGDLNGYNTRSLELSFGYPVSQPRYMASEPTMPGLLLFFGVQYASDITQSLVLSNAEKAECVNAIAFFGSVSTAASSPWVIPEKCQDKAVPYKLAIAPDNTFTRSYFYETMKLWYPRTAISNSTAQGSANKVTVPSFEDSVMFFNSDADLEAYITGTQYGKSLANPKIFGAIVFDQVPDDASIGKYASIEYSIRLNSTQKSHDDLNTAPRTIGTPFESPFQRTIDMSYNHIYTRMGFMTLQTAVTRFVNCMPHWDATKKSTNGTCQQELAIAAADPAMEARLFEAVQKDMFLQTALPRAFGGSTKTALNELNSITAADRATLLYPLRIAPQAYFGTEVAPFPVESFVSAPFYDSVKTVFALVFVLSYLYAISRVLVVMIQEKETRSREYMKILGVQEGS